MKCRILLLSFLAFIDTTWAFLPIVSLGVANIKKGRPLTPPHAVSDISGDPEYLPRPRRPFPPDELEPDPNGPLTPGAPPKRKYGMFSNVIIDNPVLDRLDPYGCYKRLPELLNDKIFWRDMSLLALYFFIGWILGPNPMEQHAWTGLWDKDPKLEEHLALERIYQQLQENNFNFDALDLSFLKH